MRKKLMEERRQRRESEDSEVSEVSVKETQQLIGQESFLGK